MPSSKPQHVWARAALPPAMRKLWFNSVFLSAGFALAQGFTALAYLITARSVGPSAFGQVAAYVGGAMLLVAAGDFGFTSWVIRELARTDSRDTFATTLGVRAVIAGSIGLLWIIVTIPTAAAGITPWYATVLGLWIAASLLWATLLAPLQANERMHEVAAVTALERLVLLAVVGLGTLAAFPAAALAIGLSAGGIASALFAILLVEPSARGIQRPRVRDIRAALGASKGFALSSLAIQAQRLDVAIVGLASGSYTAGIYAAPARLTNALGILPTAFSTSLFPRAAKQRGAIWTAELLQPLAALLLVMVAITTPIFIFAPTLAETILGQQYRSSGDVLQIILIGMIVASANQPIAMTYQARGLEQFVAKAIAAGSSFGLGTIAIGAILGGAKGAAFGFIAHQVTVLAVLAVRPPKPSQSRGLDGSEERVSEKVASHAHL